MPNKQCRQCGKVKPVEDFHFHHKSKDGRVHVCKSCKPRKPSWVSAEFKAPEVYFKEQKAKKDGELLKVNQELIGVCQGYKDEISKLSEVIDNQKLALETQAKKLEHYLFEEQKQVTKTLKDDLNKQREARREQ